MTGGRDMKTCQVWRLRRQPHATRRVTAPPQTLPLLQILGVAERCCYVAWTGDPLAVTYLLQLQPDPSVTSQPRRLMSQSQAEAETVTID